jgi:glucarate dehydratase
LSGEKLKNFDTYTVSVPIEAPIRHAVGVHPGWFTMTVVRIETTSGFVGWGETGGGGFSVRELLKSLGSRMIGEDLFNLQKIQWKYASPITATYYNQLIPQMWFPIETALLDAQGQALGLPLHSLIGGKVQDSIRVSAYFFPRYVGENGGGGETQPEETLKLLTAWKRKYGFNVFKLKGGVFPPRHDVDTLKLLNNELPDAKFRIDPNGVWSLPEAIQVADDLWNAHVRMEYLEDPVWALGEMARLRDFVSWPLATNTSVTRFDDMVGAHALKAVDIVLGDPHWWWGMRGYQQLGKVCQVLGLTVGMHSPGELGIGLAAMVHTAASTPQLGVAIDTHYMHLLDDIVDGGVKIEGGTIRVPDGPGLGVRVSEDKVDKYQKLYQEKKDYIYSADPERPDWFPSIPQHSYAKCDCHAD